MQPLVADLVEPSLLAVGPVVDDLYPHGEAKLRRRCEDALGGRARGHVVTSGSAVIAFAMESPKGPGLIKLSTIWVHPQFRGSGVGRSVAASLVQQWRDTRIERVHVTARLGVHSSVAGALAPFGFTMVACEENRYGVGEHEAVLAWTPGADQVDACWTSFHADRLLHAGA
jgi:ribosomal protein S18 acetylase RimI-like enzyme